LATDNFDKLLLEAVDEGLSSLGESSKQAIYFHLEKTFSIKKQQIPEKIADFAQAIHRIFGLGANFLEILIIKRLYEKIGVVFELVDAEELALAKYVTVAKRTLREENIIKEKKELIECEGLRIEV
jgi:hypothetical protein